MAINSWLNIPVSTGCMIYRLWKAVASLLHDGVLGDCRGSWTVVDTSAGANPGWTGDASPGNAGWVVVQCENANADGTKLQVFIGYKTGFGLNLAGFGNQATGYWMAASPNGGWNASSKFFGATLGDWRNGLQYVDGVGLYTNTLGLVIWSGTTDRPGRIAILGRQGTAALDYAFLAGFVQPPVNLPENPSGMCKFAGTASSDTGNGQWSNSSGSMGRCCVTTRDAYTATGKLVHMDYGRDRSGPFVEAEDVWVNDTAAGYHLGVADGIRRCSAPNGTLSGTTESATRWVWGGLSWPREPSRDGAWI